MRSALRAFIVIEVRLSPIATVRLRGIRHVVRPTAQPIRRPGASAHRARRPPHPGLHARCLRRRPQLHDLARPRSDRHPGVHPAEPADDHLAAERQDRPEPRRRPPLPLYPDQARVR